MTISNNLSVGTGSSNTGALIVVDEEDISLQQGALGGVFPVNMITGLDVGTQKLVPATFVNDNYDISYGLGTVTVQPPMLRLTVSDPVPVNTTATVTATYGPDVSFIEWEHDIPADSLLAVADPTKQLAIRNATPAVYPVSLQYKNDFGNFTTPAVYVVFYDPTAGFVTGGGSVNSPIISSLPYMQVGGEASFGFVSKYVKGKTEPTGNTQFEFQAGGLSFKSTSYKWLVVSGARAQYKGMGTINEAGSYGFILTAIDGALLGTGGLDRFRIKIWEESTGIILYDNVYGADDNADLLTQEATKLSSGSVVIHTGSTKGQTKGTTTSRQESLDEHVYAGKLKATVMPNPSSSYFSLVLESGSTEPVSLTVTDIMGRVVERKTGVAANGSLRLGDKYGAGTYLVELRQGSEQRFLRLLKANK
jgi:hypothetical protein